MGILVHVDSSLFNRAASNASLAEELLSGEKCAQGFPVEQVSDQRDRQYEAHKRNDKKGDRSSTVELFVVCLQLPRQNAKREPVCQREEEQECEQPEGLQTEEADLGKSTCKLQSGNIEQPKRGPEYQYQNQLHDALQHRAAAVSYTHLTLPTLFAISIPWKLQGESQSADRFHKIVSHPIMAIGRSLLEAAPALFLLYYWGL